MTPDVLGRPLEEAERLLREADVTYTVERTRPTRHFFPVDEEKLYVVRALMCPDGSCRLTAAAKQRKEV